jgi:peptide/nickel transport system substrate-binding protein
MSTRFSRRKISVIVAAVVIIAVIAAWSYFSVITPKIPNPNKFIFATAQEIAQLDPNSNPVTNTQFRETYLMYDRLATFRGSSVKPELMLVDSYEISPDSMTWTFHVKQGIKFHDGSPLDAKAVEFSFWRNMKIGAASFPLLGVIDENSTKAIDTYTVQMNLLRPFAPLLAVLATPWFPIVSPKVMDHEVDGDLGVAWLSQNEAGSGPFTLKEFVPSQRIVLSAVKDYWGGAPKIDEMDVLIVTEASSQRLMLERGEIDGAEEIPTIALSELEKNPDFKVVNDPGFTTIYMAINTEKVKDVRVRQAIAYAIDYDGIISGVLFGRAIRLTNAFPKGFPGYDESIPLYNRDLDKARALLSEAGYANGLELNLYTSSRNEDWVKIATLIQSNLAEVNIKVNIQQFAWPTYIHSIVAGDHDLCLMGTTPDYPAPDDQAMMFYYSGSVPDFNSAFYRNTRIDQLYLEGSSSQDENKRLEIYHELQMIAYNDVPYVWLGQPKGYYGIVLRSWVQGYAFNPMNPWFMPADTIYKAPP